MEQEKIHITETETQMLTNLIISNANDVLSKRVAEFLLILIV